MTLVLVEGPLTLCSGVVVWVNAIRKLHINTLHWYRRLSGAEDQARKYREFAKFSPPISMARSLFHKHRGTVHCMAEAWDGLCNTVLLESVKYVSPEVAASFVTQLSEFRGRHGMKLLDPGRACGKRCERRPWVGQL
jgi:hypothetical protein